MTTFTIRRLTNNTLNGKEILKLLLWTVGALASVFAGHLCQVKILRYKRGAGKGKGKERKGRGHGSGFTVHTVEAEQHNNLKPLFEKRSKKLQEAS